MGLMNKKVVKYSNSQQHKLLYKERLKVMVYNTDIVK